MSVDLFERYKDALRRGHVAAARGELEAALGAYDEAVALAPERALPHTSMGLVQLKLGTPADALVAFNEALSLAARDEGALRGRADALTRLGRRTDAAETLDLLSDVQDRAGRLADATETAQRALDLAEQKGRRRHVQELTRRVRVSSADKQAGDALAKALRILERDDAATEADVARTKAVAAASEVEAAADREAARAGLAAARAADAATAAAAAREAAVWASAAAAVSNPAAATDATDAADGVDAPAATVEAGAAAEAMTPTPEPVEAAAPDGPETDGIVLVGEAELAVDAGDMVAARRAFLAAAAAFQAEGLLAAALDACYYPLAFAPADPELHLALVELYLELGWDAMAADKLALLGRLTELDGAAGNARSRIIGLAADHFPDDPRLSRLSA